MEYGVYGDLINTYPKPYSIYLRGTIIVTGPNTGVGSTAVFLLFREVPYISKFPGISGIAVIQAI